MATNITLKQFIDMWEPVTPSKIDLNAHNFVAASATHMQLRFKSSFNQGFYGTPWATRTSKWGVKHKHRVLLQTGDLKNSIKVNTDPGSDKNYIASANVHTTASSSRKRTGDTSGYAAVHNSDPNTTNYTVNGRSRKRPVQRQFMGFSTHADSYIASNYITQLLLDQIPH